MAQDGAPQMELAWSLTAEAPVVRVAIPPASDTLLVADQERDIQILDGRGNVLGNFRAGQPVRRLRSDRMGNVFAALAGDAVVYAFDSEGQFEWRVELAGEIADFSLASDGGSLAAISPEGWLHLYSAATRERMVIPAGAPMASVAIVNDDPVEVVMVTGRGDLLRMDSSRASRWRKDYKSNLGELSVSVPGDVILVPDRARGVRLLALEGRETGLHDVGEPVVRAEISDDGTRFMAETESGRMVLLNVRGDILWETALEVPPPDWAFGDGGRALAIVTGEREVALYRTDVSAGPPLPPPPPGEPAIATVGNEDGAGASTPDFMLGDGFVLELDLADGAGAGTAGAVAETPAAAPAAEPEVEFTAEIAEEPEAVAEPAYALPSEGTLLWKRKLRANALPAAQSLFRVALGGRYFVAMLTDGRALALDEKGDPAVKAAVGLPARLVPAHPNKMVGAWTSEQIVILHPAGGKSRIVVFPEPSIKSVACSEDFRMVCALSAEGTMWAYKAGDVAAWEKQVGEVADSVHVSPRGRTIVVADKDGRYRFFDVDGQLQSKFRFPSGDSSRLLGVADDFSVFGWPGGRLRVVDAESTQLWGASLFSDVSEVEVLGRTFAVYGASGGCALVDPQAQTVHEMSPPAGRVRLRIVPSLGPVVVHIAGRMISAFTGVQSSLNMAWRYECPAGIEMFAADMDAGIVVALAGERLYCVEGRYET